MAAGDESPTGAPVREGLNVPNGYQQITALSVAVGLTIPGHTTFCIIQCEKKDVRWRDDGTVPTGTVGMILRADEVLMYSGFAKNFRVIESFSGAILNVSYYR